MNSFLGVLRLKRNSKERIEKVRHYSNPLKITNEFD